MGGTLEDELSQLDEIPQSKDTLDLKELNEDYLGGVPELDKSNNMISWDEDEDDESRMVGKPVVPLLDFTKLKQPQVVVSE